jgi:hypothetical protein
MPATLTPNYTVGKAVAVTVGAALAYAKGGSLPRSVASINVSNARSGGYQQRKAGMKGASLSLDLVYNGDDPPTGIVEGNEVTVIFDSIGFETAESIMDASTTPTGRLITGQFLIVTVKDTWQAESDYGWSIECESTGPYTVVETATGLTTIT